MKKFGSPNIVCGCEGDNHTCGIEANSASNDQPLDTVENMSVDADSSAGNAGVVPPMNEDSGIDIVLNADVPSVPSAFSSEDTSPDAELSLSIDTSSGIISISTSSASERQSDNADKATRTSSVPPKAATGTDSRPSSPTDLEAPTIEAGGAEAASADSGTKTSTSRPSSFSPGLRRSYHEFQKSATSDDGILKSIPYVYFDDKFAKKKKTEEENNPEKKSTSSSGGSKSRTSSTSQSVESSSQSVESCDTSYENLSGGSGEAQRDNDWYLRMRTTGPKVRVTGNVRADGTINETQEHRSSIGSSFLSVNPSEGGDVCENIYFGRKSPSLGGDDVPPEQEENPRPKSDEGDSEGNEEKDA